MRRTRWLISALAVAASTGGAGAADFGIPFLRGSNSYEIAAPARWDGLYFGAHVGWTTIGADFGPMTSVMGTIAQVGPMAAPAVGALGMTDTSGTHFGGFIGYNIQVDGAVIGLEGSYSRFNTTVSAINLLAGNYVSADGNLYPYNGNGTASVHFTDLGTMRVRGGWAAGSFMPYGAIGIAVGRADLIRQVDITATPPTGSGLVFTPPFAPLTLNSNLSGQFLYGYTLAAGLDFALTNCFFVRAEYEYVSFGDFQSVKLHLHNMRLAAAYKF